MSVPSIDDAITRHAAWRDRGPIRVWRQANRCSTRDLASILDVSVSALVNWENGISVPAQDICAKLGRLSGDEHFRAVLLDWFAEKPAV